MDTTTEKPAKPRRRWLRFRLRILLIVVMVLSVPLGWVGWRLQQVRREQATITWVEKMGGRVYFFSAPYYHQQVSASANRLLRISASEYRLLNSSLFNPYAYKRSWWEKTTAKWFGERVEGVILGKKQVSDLSPLAKLKNLKDLHLDNTQVSDLSPLAPLQASSRQQTGE